MEDSKKNWIDAMIEREALPKPLREGTIEEFAEEWNISSETYFYQRRKKENKKRIVQIWLNQAMDDGNEVLKKLAEKAKAGDNKSMELYIKFVLELAENLDIKSDGKAIQQLAGFDYVKANKTDNSSTTKTGQGLGETTGQNN